MVIEAPPMELERPPCKFVTKASNEPLVGGGRIESEEFCGEKRSPDSEWCPEHRDRIRTRRSEMVGEAIRDGDEIVAKWLKPPVTVDELAERFSSFTKDQWCQVLRSQVPPPEYMEPARPYTLCARTGPNIYELLYMVVIKDEEGICHFYVVGLSGRGITRLTTEVKEEQAA